MKYSFSVCMFVCVVFNAVSQTLSPVTTQKCSNVNAYIVPENSQAWIDATNAYAASQFPNATIISNSSQTYNCHGYAWHMSNGGSTRWIGYYVTTDEDIYWGDGSYVEVSGRVTPSATKVSYASSDHSAITTTDPNVFISKWGQWPLMRHSPTYTPYNSSNLKYYVSSAAIVTQSSPLCNTSALSVSNLSPSATVVWQSSNPSAVSVSSTGVTTRLNNFNGNVTITANVNSGCGNSFTLSQNLNIGAGISSVFLTNIGATKTSSNKYFLTCRLPIGIPYSPAPTFKWYIDNVLRETTNSTDGWDFNASGACNSLHTLRVEAFLGCGVVLTNQQQFSVNCSGGSGGALAVYPNPTSNNLTISFENDLNSTLSSSKAESVLSSEFSVNLYDSLNQKRKSGKSINSQIVIDVSDLPKGFYFLRVNRADELIVRQILIEK
jgi:hypothetical protein